jgi:acyl-CoA synthetase (NDP forming)
VKASVKPIIAIGISEDMTSNPATNMLRQARVPFIPSSTKAVTALRRYVRVADASRSAEIRFTPAPQSTGVTPLVGNGSLSEDASEDLLRLYGIAFPPGGVGGTEDKCLSIAEAVGFPMVLKGTGDEVLPKSDVVLVRLGITNEAELRSADKKIYVNHETAVGAPGNVKVAKMVTDGAEFICGMSVDLTFGLLLTFGLGGIYAELLEDVAMELCQLTIDQVRKLISHTKTANLLAGARGKIPLDIGAAAEIGATLSQFAHEHATELAKRGYQPA